MFSQPKVTGENDINILGLVLRPVIPQSILVRNCFCEGKKESSFLLSLLY